MKHPRFSLLILSLFALLLCSCESPYVDEGTTPATPKGNLTVSVFQLEQTPFSDDTRTALSDACSRLNVAIYNPDGSRVKQVNQTSADAGFGEASFQLAEGTYQLVIVAHSASANPTMTDPAKIQFTNATGYTDTFLYSEDISVTDQTQTLSVTLKRIAALCRFVLTDESIPAEVKKMRFYYTGGSGAFNATTGFGCVNSKQDVKFDISSGQKQFDLYTFLHDTTGTIHLTVSALDASGGELLQRDFDVPLEQNKITWFSGPFFDGSGSQGNSFIITIDTTWDGEIKLTF